MISSKELGTIYKDGQEICRQGEPGDFMYVIQQGKVEVIIEKPEGETRLCFLGAGDIFGEISLLTGKPRTATVRAFDQARIITIDKRGFLRKVHQDPTLALHLLNKMSQRIKSLSEEVLQLRLDLKTPSVMNSPKNRMCKIIAYPQEPEEQVWKLASACITIGRSSRNSICIPDKDSLSRKHARLDITDSEIFLTDLRSENGTFVNERRINHCSIAAGDKFRCGDVVFLLLMEPEEPKTLDLRPIVKEISNTGRITIQNLQLKDSGKASDYALNEQNKLRALLQISEILCSPEEGHLVLSKVVDLVFQILNVDRVAIVLINEQTGELEPQIKKTKSEIQSEQFYSHHIVEHVVQNNVSVLSADAQLDPRFEESVSVRTQSIRSSMCVPLRAHDEVIGAIYVDNLLLANRFNVAELEFLTGFANQAGLAIQNSRLYARLEEEARQREEKLQLLVDERTQNLLEEKEKTDSACMQIQELAKNLEIRNRFIQRTFGRYLSPELVAGFLESPEKLQLGGESRRVTILLSDLRGFTEATEHLAPVDVLRLLNHYLGEMAKIILRFQGTIFEFIGDAILAVFGAPASADDDAERAVACAVAMQQAMQRVNQSNVEDGLPQLLMGIGVHTGDVIVGNIGSEQRTKYGIVGPAVNLAARIESCTLGNQILVSESTMNLARNLIVVQDEFSISPKGLSDPVKVYDVKGIRGHPQTEALLIAEKSEWRDDLH